MTFYPRVEHIVRSRSPIAARALLRSCRVRVASPDRALRVGTRFPHRTSGAWTRRHGSHLLRSPSVRAPGPVPDAPITVDGRLGHPGTSVSETAVFPSDRRLPAPGPSAAGGSRVERFPSDPRRRHASPAPGNTPVTHYSPKPLSANDPRHRAAEPGVIPRSARWGRRRRSSHRVR
jgi:hypothetical protein